MVDERSFAVLAVFAEVFEARFALKLKLSVPAIVFAAMLPVEVAVLFDDPPPAEDCVSGGSMTSVPPLPSLDREEGSALPLESEPVMSAGPSPPSAPYPPQPPP